MQRRGLEQKSEAMRERRNAREMKKAEEGRKASHKASFAS
jgi:hypothetical protein